MVNIIGILFLILKEGRDDVVKKLFAFGFFENEKVLRLCTVYFLADFCPF
jgi:hypothetical protein